MIKAIVCEVCGSNDMIKKEGYFECQHCGTKHVLKRDMVYETPEMKRERNKQEKLDEIENILMLARQAVKRNDAENVIKYFDEYFDKILQYNDEFEYLPSTWDSHFYPTYYKILACPIKNLTDGDYWVSGIRFTFGRLVESRLPDDELIKNAKMVANGYVEIANHLYDSAKKIYSNSESKENFQAFKTLSFRCNKVRDILYEVGDVLTDEYYPYYRNQRLVEFAVEAWKSGVEKHIEMHNSNFLDVDVELGQSYIIKILKYDKSYKPPVFVKKIHSKGCYIATCVYGSYDCPEVWVLRRFRDSVLAKSVLGRLSINFYYAVSPRLVSKFGKSNLFRKIWQKPLNALVSLLRQKGFEDTPYND